MASAQGLFILSGGLIQVPGKICRKTVTGEFFFTLTLRVADTSPAGRKAAPLSRGTGHFAEQPTPVPEACPMPIDDAQRRVAQLWKTYKKTGLKETRNE